MKKSVVYLLILYSLLPLVLAQQPSIQVLSPTEGASVPSGSVPITFEVQNHENYGEPLHVHFTLDTNAPQMHFSFESYTLQNVEAGTHTLLVELVNANHVPLSNPEAHVFVSFVSTEDGRVAPLQEAKRAAPSSVPLGQVYEAVSDDSCNNGVQDANEEGVDCGTAACGVGCAVASSGEVAPSGETGEVPIGEATGYQRVLSGIKGSMTSILLLLLAAGTIVGGYYGYTKLVQGHFVGVPPETPVNQQLYNYIKQCRTQGFSRQVIYTKLRELKFSDKDLNYHFTKVEQELPRAK